MIAWPATARICWLSLAKTQNGARDCSIQAMAGGSPTYFAQFQMPVQSQGVSFVHEDFR
jgi:hypothetical protein